MTLLTSYCKDTDWGRLTNKCAIRSKQTTKSNSNFSLCLIGNHCVPKFSGCVAVILTSLWFSFFSHFFLGYWNYFNRPLCCNVLKHLQSFPHSLPKRRFPWHAMSLFLAFSFPVEIMPSITCKLSIKKLIFIRDFFCFLPIRDRWCQRAFI